MRRIFLHTASIILSLCLVAGCGDSGETEKYEEQLFGNGMQPPTVPADISLKVVSGDRIDLAWSESRDAGGIREYRIFRDGEPIGSLSAAIVSDTGLVSGVSHCYQISAIDPAGNESARSAQVCGTTMDVISPDQPSRLTVTVVSGIRVDLAWSAPGDNVGVDGYRIYRDGAHLATVTASAATDTGLVPATSHCYRVSALDAAGNESAMSAQVCGTTIDTIPPDAPPDDPSLVVVSETRIDLTWPASTDNVAVTGYRVYRDGLLLKGVTASAVLDVNLSPDSGYCYQVSALDAAGNESSKSGQACGTTLPDIAAPEPPDISAAGVTVTRIDLSWPPSTDNIGVAGYRIFRDGSGSPITTVSTNAWSDIGLGRNDSHCYTVVAYDAAGNEASQSAQTCAATRITGGISDTGQATSYTASPGEDSDYAINPPSYTDNADGTVTDNVTGLVWQQQDDGVERDWFAATGYCDGLTLGGTSDWRLPGDKELMTIIDYDRFNPTMDTAYFQTSSSSTSLSYWSSTSSPGSSVRACILKMTYGQIGDAHKNLSSVARCVRGEVHHDQLWVDKGDGTVIDVNTGLVWQKADEASSLSWEGAIAYCEGLTTAGYSDWRLPNKKELLSIVDRSRESPAIDTNLFPDALKAAYWSSTSLSSIPADAWSVNFVSGSSLNKNKTLAMPVRCIRGGQ